MRAKYKQLAQINHVVLQTNTTITHFYVFKVDFPHGFNYTYYIVMQHSDGNILINSSGDLK